MQTKFFERSEGTLAYDDSGGQGELVLMLPGMGDLRQEYRFVVNPLHQAGYRVVTADLRGHGQSSAGWAAYTVPAVGQDILALIDHLDAGPAHLVTTSFSPSAAVWAAVENPQAVRSIVAVNPFLRQQKTSFAMQAAMGVMFNGPWKVWAWGLFYQSLYPTHKPADFDTYKAQLKANLAEPGRFAALKGLMAAPKTPGEERMEQVAVPTLVVMGSKDPDFPAPEEEGQILADRLSARLVVIEGSGHYPQADNPEQFLSALLDFLKTSPSE